MIKASQLKTPDAKRDLRGWLNTAAAGQGFSLVGIGPATIGVVNENGLTNFLDCAFEGDMEWLPYYGGKTHATAKYVARRQKCNCFGYELRARS